MPSIQAPQPDLSLGGGSSTPYRNQAVGTVPGIGSTLLSRGLFDAASGLSNVSRQLESKALYDFSKKEALANAVIAAKEKRYKEDVIFETQKMSSQITNDWLKRTKQYEENPKENQLEIFEKEFDEYTVKTIEGIGDPFVRREMEVHLLQRRNSLIPSVFQIESQARQENFASDLSVMFSNAEDSIYTEKTIQSVLFQQALLRDTVSKAHESGRVKDKSTVDSLNAKISNLSVSWAYANMSTDPAIVLEMLDSKSKNVKVFEGLPAHQRDVIRRAAESSLDAKSKFDALAIKEAHQSNVSNIVAFGKPISTQDSYISVIEATSGKTAAKLARAEIDTAYAKYEANEASKGATSGELIALAQDFIPKEGASQEEFERQSEVLNVVKKASELKENDPFTHFAQHPSIRELLNDENASSPEIVEKVLELQRGDPSIQDHELAVMSRDSVDKFLNDFSNAVSVDTKGDSVYKSLTELQTTYGRNTILAVNQIARTAKGSQVAHLLNPLMWHFNNPTVFNLITDSVRKDDKEVLKRLGEPAQIQQFEYSVANDSRFVQYRKSIEAYDNSPDAANHINGIQTAFRAFARDQLVAGGNLGKASQVFFDRFAFTEYNNVPIALPKRWYDSTTGSSRYLNMDNYQEKISFTASANAALNEVITDKNLDVSSLIPVNELMSQENISTDLAQQIKSNVFLSVSPDESKFYLYVKGSVIGTSRQVSYKDGTPVTISMEKLLNGKPVLNELPDVYF